MLSVSASVSTVPGVMIVDLDKLGDLTDKQRRHLELSIYVGYALERAQNFEQRIVYLIALTDARHDPDNDEKFQADIESLMSRKQVALLKRCIQGGLITQEIAEACEKARRGRNEFVHRFYVEHDFHSKAGVDRAWWKVQHYHSLFDQVGALLEDAIRKAVIGLDVSEEQIASVQVLVDEIQGEDWAQR